MSKRNRLVFASGALLAIAVALLLAGCQSAEEENTKAEEAIKALGGKVVRDEKLNGKPIIQVDFSDTKVTDAGLKELAGLKTLQALTLNSTQVTDAGLKELAGFTRLLSLYLDNTQVTDAGLKELPGLTSLQTLTLQGTSVTDAGVKELTGLKDLRVLYLHFTCVTKAGAEELRKALPNCNVQFRTRKK